MIRDFRTQNSRELIQSLLQSAWQADFRIYMWHIVGNQQCEVELKFVVVNSPKKEIIFEYDPKDIKEVGKILAPKVDINFFAPQEMMLFRSMVKQVIPHENRIKIRYPANLSITERRVRPRYLVVNRSPVMKLSFKLDKRMADGKTFTKNCYDFSQGGLSFIINKSETSYFKVGDVLENSVIHIGTLACNAKLKIVTILPIEPSDINGLLYLSYKIGVQFLDKTDETVHKLTDIVDFMEEHFQEKA